MLLFLLIFLTLLPTFSRYKQFGIKLSSLFGFAKSFQIQNQLQIKPKTQIACSVCYWRLVLSKLQLNRKLFTLLLANSNFQVSAFRFVIFGVLFSIIYFRILNSAQRISSFGWQIPIFTFLLFTLQLFKFLLADSDFHASDFQVSTFCWQVPIFTLLLCYLSAWTNVYFLIVFICVISAQLLYNVLALQAVWD